MSDLYIGLNDCCYTQTTTGQISWHSTFMCTVYKVQLNFISPTVFLFRAFPSKPQDTDLEKVVHENEAVRQNSIFFAA